MEFQGVLVDPVFQEDLGYLDHPGGRGQWVWSNVTTVYEELAMWVHSPVVLSVQEGLVHQEGHDDPTHCEGEREVHNTPALRP